MKDEERIKAVIDDIKQFGAQIGLRAGGIAEAPREKRRKNKEYFILWEK